MKTTAIAIMIAALAGAPMAAMAQGTTPSANDMKGPPNANGYGKDQGMDKTDTDPSDKTPSAKDMKGPPNANGYQPK